MIFFVIAVILLILDQITKWIVFVGIPVYSRVTVINGFFYLAHVYNTGAAWSLFQGANWIFVSLAFAAIICLIIFMLKIKNKKYRLALALILGGTAGNLTDRLFGPFYRHMDGVLDFLEFHFGNYVYPIFNVADSCIVIGGVLLVLLLLLDERKEKKNG